MNRADAKKSAGEKAEEVDAEIFEAIRPRKKLISGMEDAKGIHYTEPLKTRWNTLQDITMFIITSI